jgi:hypothetical protein
MRPTCMCAKMIYDRRRNGHAPSWSHPILWVLYFMNYFFNLKKIFFLKLTYGQNVCVVIVKHLCACSTWMIKHRLFSLLPISKQKSILAPLGRRNQWWQFCLREDHLKTFYVCTCSKVDVLNLEALDLFLVAFISHPRLMIKWIVQIGAVRWVEQ